MIKSTFQSGIYYCVSYAREEDVFVSEKIVCPQFSPSNTFAYDNSEWFAASDVYFIKQKPNGIRLKFLLGILNSRLCYFWLYNKGQKKGSLLQLFKGPLSEIPINVSTPNVQNQLITYVDLILAAKRTNPEADTSEWEMAIDRLIYKLYGLTNDEICVVEGKA